MEARRDDFEIAHTFVPAGTLVPPEADLGWFKTCSCGAHLCLEFGAIGPDGMEDHSHFASDGNLGLFAPMRLASLLPQRLSAEPRLTTVSRTFAASNK
ncbi:hypothetical protein [Bradyrhizobium japonicum]|uniref:hypothetical protein n=1 Tax=Bradyrhizobium japonicum TaxID=375 RepID=UPI0028993CC2|nr:hypothetical protein [Bradyrhizobium japonicum]MEB2671199.1 hypothetical protein [Bradyrhizobium japonicum]WRI90518.1 hypothetical protein R3F75_06115 [Bradyrhizobium japonicum]WRJ84680.1 hypothetical protein R3F78_07200 [Bradyrhizobium japonicum]WRJ93651.1 hypothetical protein R3F77_04915 [Bradyrhizobium japonicum]WRK47503.1 hypothetical protein R3F73_04965 [Bradyrhizobium japonicum]